MSRFAIPRFREIPPLKTATIGVSLIVAALLLVSVIPSLPWVRGHVYTAVFSESGGLKKRDEVRVSGLPVGEVISTRLVGTTVEVEFSAKGVDMSQNATAAIKTGTLLGKRYLGIEPGDGPDMTDYLIPISRTSTPYNVSRSIEDVSAQLRDFDKPKIEESLNAFADAFQDTPANFQHTLQNVKALSVSISSRDQALRELLQHTNQVSTVLNDRTSSFERILLDGNELLGELQRRQQVVNDLFRQLNYVADQTRQFVRENNDSLQPALSDINDVLQILQHNNDNLQLAINRVGSFITGLGEGVADGPGFRAAVQLYSAGAIFNYTDLLRQNPLTNPGHNPTPRLPQTPCGPGGLDTPNPLYAPPAGANSQRPLPPSSDACGIPPEPGWNAKKGSN